MKITLQTLKSVKYEIEVKDTDTVRRTHTRAPALQTAHGSA